MPKKAISDEQQELIRAMGKTMTAKQISRELKLNYTTVMSFMNTRNIERKLGKKPRTLNHRRTSDLFNVYERGNWLV
jgi:DNA-binding NarL/FixJ family response regulator